jgi:hypothetical protein
MRNDIQIPSYITATIKNKPYHIPFYDKEVNRYGHYDDSARIYTMIDRVIINEEFINRPLNLGDYHRIHYIIKNSNLDSRIEINHKSVLATTKTNKKFNINKHIDMGKSYIIANNYSIKEFEVYDSEGELYAKFK